MNTALAIDYVDPKTDHKFHLPIFAFKKPSNVREYAKLEKLLDELIDEAETFDSNLPLKSSLMN